MKLAIIGIGYVGKAITRLFAGRYDLIAKDVNFEIECDAATYTPNKIMVLSTDYEKVNTCDAAIICVPTAMRKDGSCDTSIVEFVIKNCQCRYILIKSTVPPGTTKRLAKQYQYSRRIVFSPEYLGESKYYTPAEYPHPTDLKQHSFQIFGGERSATNFFVELFQRVMGPSCRYFQTDSTTAELVKYMENAWGATKVTFANEFYRIAQTFGADYREVRELWLLDGRIERAHTCVFENNFGYGGKCLPKDINAIIQACMNKGYAPELLVEVEKSNKRFRKENDAQDIS